MSSSVCMYCLTVRVLLFQNEFCSGPPRCRSLHYRFQLEDGEAAKFLLGDRLLKVENPLEESLFPASLLPRSTSRNKVGGRIQQLSCTSITWTSRWRNWTPCCRLWSIQVWLLSPNLASASRQRMTRVLSSLLTSASFPRLFVIEGPRVWYKLVHSRYHLPLPWKKTSLSGWSQTRTTPTCGGFPWAWESPGRRRISRGESAGRPRLRSILNGSRWWPLVRWSLVYFSSSRNPDRGCEWAAFNSLTVLDFKFSQVFLGFVITVAMEGLGDKYGESARFD